LEVLIPHLVVPGLAQEDKSDVTRLRGFGEKAHTRLSGGLATFALVTRFTGGDHVLPHSLAAPVPRDNVINGEFALGKLGTTVLTGIVITSQNCPPCKRQIEISRHLHIGDQADHKGYRKRKPF